MATYFGVTSAVFFIWVMTFTAQTYFTTGSILSPCRITGVGIYHEKKANFSEASNACNQLNLQLASKDQVEKALKHGFETCSYGWVKDGLAVIPRITSNKKCGQGNIGLVPWYAEPFKTFKVYCFNSSEATTTKMPEEDPPTDSPNYTSYAAFNNDAIVFGGIPTALLVLAVIFFIISVVLAVCYIKKYKKTFPFSNKNQQKDMVETTALKEAKSNDETPKKKTKNNGKKVEESKTKPEATVKCLEAEV
ncbi:lymphatic vessel endothelial hyaluronic acid receptor 1 isoform X2 [Pelecanus crispus]|uniref:lymphatic vessel endothelial hyaluronic acid receptor 1 isoform X2 n=1 Tax=Pelecanus crispus TaxID=36300 RepID=UPI003F5D1F6D